MRGGGSLCPSSTKQDGHIQCCLNSYLILQNARVVFVEFVCNLIAGHTLLSRLGCNYILFESYFEYIVSMYSEL